MKSFKATMAEEDHEMNSEAKVIESKGIKPHRRRSASPAKSSQSRKLG